MFLDGIEEEVGRYIKQETARLAVKVELESRDRELRKLLGVTLLQVNHCGLWVKV